MLPIALALASQSVFFVAFTSPGYILEGYCFFWQPVTELLHYRQTLFTGSNRCLPFLGDYDVIFYPDTKFLWHVYSRFNSKGHSGLQDRRAILRYARIFVD